MKKLAMGTLMMSAVLMIGASTCQAAGKDWNNRGGDPSSWSRSADRNDHNRARGHDRDDRDRGHATFFRSPAYRPVVVCPPPAYYYYPAPVYVARPCYRPGFSFRFGW